MRSVSLSITWADGTRCGLGGGVKSERLTQGAGRCGVQCARACSGRMLATRAPAPCGCSSRAGEDVLACCSASSMRPVRRPAAPAPGCRYGDPWNCCCCCCVEKDVPTLPLPAAEPEPHCTRRQHTAGRRIAHAGRHASQGASSSARTHRPEDAADKPVATAATPPAASCCISAVTRWRSISAWRSRIHLLCWSLSSCSRWLYLSPLAIAQLGPARFVLSVLAATLVQLLLNRTGTRTHPTPSGRS